MRSRLLPSLLQSRKLVYKYSKPFTNNVVTYFQLKQITQFSTNNKKYFKNDKNDESRVHNLIGSAGITHKIFKEEDAEIIFDISEKQETINLEDLMSEEEHYDPYEGINLKRGINGVFEIEELVSLLQRDNAKNIFVASVPSELSYVDYMVVVTGKSNKHMKALAVFIRKVYKLKKHKADLIPKIEGQTSKDWIALDLGNIALHIFSDSARSLYDLETLWSVGIDYDDTNKSTTDDIMEQYNAFLSNLEPIEDGDKSKEIYEKCSLE
ncbi:Mitochondrial assembly of ribosomal large subunit protein 1 [Habropoda laboriosa]|uniref:Mitochondrial assembly of ribosomal large subunit protein 1 n=1 Tax=Habropoda laboriosa TaxID=597456 RepID=A0A0L7QVQ6_9HYME|nr:PREDICTED: mitochondrial assembly of ribosomal large subunit protein 1 [Habropoda laboriosa]KOC62703.1 Mitochondrial assembly of ribosomal large subunit protein 1 [Habropoda laboriosa]